MEQKHIMRYAVAHAGFVVLYIGLVATFMTHAPRLLGRFEDTWLAPTLFLLLFVISASVMSLLVFGRPLMWYLDGARHEAVKLAVATVGVLFAIATIFFIAAVVSFS